jgi:outer membrane protein assembly factor BamB
MFFSIFFIFSTVAFAVNNTESKAILTSSQDTAGLKDNAWPKYRYNAQNTGQSNFTGPSSPLLKWKFKTGDSIYSSPAIDNNGNIYIGSQDNCLYAITPNGKLKWKYKTDGWVYSSPAIDENGNIYMGSFDGNLYAITSNGKLKWKYKTDGWVWSSPTISNDGTVYFGSVDENLYALSPNGKLKWKYKTGFTIFSSPAIDKNGNIYIGSQDNCLYAITPNGNLKWKYETPDWIDSSPVISNDGTIYIGVDDDELYALTPNGNLKWKYETDNDVWSCPAIDKNGNIYIGSKDNCLYAITPNGKLKWKYPAGSYVSSPVIDNKGNIYFGSFDHYLYALTQNGSLKWKYKTDDWVVSSPAIGNDGTLYIGNEDSYLYAFQDKRSSVKNNIHQSVSMKSSQNEINNSLNTNSTTVPGNNFYQTDNGCSSVIIHVSDGHDVVAFRRDSSSPADLLIVKEKWYGKDIMKEYKTSGGEYFFHNIITNNGWLIGAGGGGNNKEMEKLAGEITLRGIITLKDIQRAQTILTKQELGHFIIKSPKNIIGIAISRGKNRLSKLFKLEDGAYICSPNNPSFYKEGYFSTINSDPVTAAIYIAGTDRYGVSRRNIMTYEVKKDTKQQTISAWASFDGGILIHRLKGSPDNVIFLGHEFDAKILPYIPDKLFLGDITFNNSTNHNSSPSMQKKSINAKTIPMQTTGFPLMDIILAALLVLGGIILPEKKK